MPTMTKLGWKRWLYDYGIEKIERAYEAARAALDSEANSLSAEFDEVKDQPNVDQGYLDHLSDRSTINEDSLTLIMQSFTLAIHHFWEREAKAWAGQTRYQFKQAYKAISTKGYALEKTGIEKLRKTANTIKHNSDELYTQHKSMFEQQVARDIKEGTSPDYQDGLILKDEDIREFFDAVKKSGPPQ